MKRLKQPNGEFRDLEEAIKNREALRLVMIVGDELCSKKFYDIHKPFFPSDNPDDKHITVDNYEFLRPGMVVMLVPNSTKNSYSAITLKRKKLSASEANSIIHIINFCIEYKAASYSGNTAILKKHEDFLSNKLWPYIYNSIDDRFERDMAKNSPNEFLRMFKSKFIDTYTKSLINNMVCVGAKTRKYIGYDRDELVNVPFVDLNFHNDTITYSYSRVLDHLDKGEAIDTEGEDGLINLQKAGVYRQKLILTEVVDNKSIYKPNPSNALFLKGFEKFLLQCPKSFYFNKYRHVKIPLVTKENDEYLLLDNPTFPGKFTMSFHSFMLNNLETDSFEKLIMHSSLSLERMVAGRNGYIEYVYFESESENAEKKYFVDMINAWDGYVEDWHYNEIERWKDNKERSTFGDNYYDDAYLDPDDDNFSEFFDTNTYGQLGDYESFRKRGGSIHAVIDSIPSAEDEHNDYMDMLRGIHRLRTRGEL